MSQCKLQILGCGSSTGVPIAACPCDICHSNDPYNKRLRPSALLTTPAGQNILIDTSPDLRTQAITYNITHLEAVLITHAHADHLLGFDDLRAFSFHKPGHNVKCYAIPDTMKHILHIYDYIFSVPSNYKGGMLAQIELHDITQTDAFNVCDVTIQPFKLIHGSTPTTGFRFGDTAYVTDCNEIPEDTKPFLQGLNNIIIDGLRDIPHGTHFCIAQAISVADSLQAKNIFITHMTHSVDYKTTSATLPANVKLCHDGMEITVNL